MKVHAVKIITEKYLSARGLFENFVFEIVAGKLNYLFWISVKGTEVLPEMGKTIV